MVCEGLQSFTPFVKLKKDGKVDAVFFMLSPASLRGAVNR